MTTSPETLQLGDRVRVLEDLKLGDGRVYIPKDATGIVFEIGNPAAMSEDEAPVGVSFYNGDDWVDFSEIEVITPAAEVAKEPRKYYITGTVKVELEVTVEAHSRDEAEAYFKDHAMEFLTDFDSMELKKAKVTYLAEKDLGY